MQTIRMLILGLALALACFLSASALTPTAPENRVWEIFSTGYDASATEATDLENRTETSTSNYDTAPTHRAITEAIPREASRTLFGQNAEFKAANGGGPLTIGDILAGHDPESMIHLTTATPEELATYTNPTMTPPHLTPGVFQNSSWAQLGDVAHMTVPEYQELVVGPGAAGHTSDVSAFVVSKPGSAIFEPVNVPNEANVQEYVNPHAPVVPDSYVPLPGGG